MEALNDRDFDTLSRLVEEAVAFDAHSGERSLGTGWLRSWMMIYFGHFDESVSVIVLMGDPGGQRVAADATALGTYRENLAGFPDASGQ
ncbi:hypothetical protein EWW49_37065, partial [Pseudomonas syringae]